jgi:hypothetical protein
MLDTAARPAKTFLNADGRTYRAKRWKQLRRSFLEEINGGDADRLSEGQRHLLGALTDVALQLELSRDETVGSNIVDPIGIVRLARTFARLSQQLGLEAEAAPAKAPVGDPLETYMGGKRT